MNKRVFSIMGLSFLLAAFALAVVPAQAQNVDEKIQALEQELSQLKSDQMELKREATDAAAALPNFTYRPGNGVMIEAADKAWSIRFAHEGHLRMEFMSGRDQRGRTNGEVMGRRWRPEFYYCINNCFFENVTRIDLDGFGTSTTFNIQRAIFLAHFEQINPYLPTFYIGFRAPANLSTLRQGSGNYGAQAEYDLASRNNGLNTGAINQGLGLLWNNVRVGPGRLSFNATMGSHGEGSDGLSSSKDRKNFTVFAGLSPFTDIKNKWIQGFKFEFAAWFCNADDRVNATSAVTTVDSGGDTVTITAAGTATAAVNSCTQNRVQDHGDAGRQTLYTATSSAAGRGPRQYLLPAIGWTVGPYSLRAIMGFMNYDSNNESGAGTGAVGIDHKARNFLIGHDIFLWSPKGFLTGATTVPGSILFGTHFERNDYSAGCGNGKAACPSNINGGEFHRNRILLREWDLWYFLPNRMSVGMSVLWYDASNLRSGRTNAGENLGVFRPGCTTCTGKGGDWTDVHLNWRWYF